MSRMWSWGLSLMGETGTEESPVLHGEIAEDSPAAVALAEGSTFICSGSLVTPRLVLTAAHCYDEDRQADLTQAIVGIDLTEPEATLEIVRSSIHPDYVPYDSGLGIDGSAGQGLNDVSLLELAEDAPVEPVWFRTEPIKPRRDQGVELEVVGWGYDEYAVKGIKRTATLTIGSIDPMFLRTWTIDNANGANSCDGDSGAPLYHIEEDGTLLQWSVHAWGNCDQTANSAEATESGSTRVDKVSDWLLEEIERVHGTTDRCEIFGQYGDGVCHDDCAEVDEDCLPPDEEEESPVVEEEVPAGCGCNGAPTTLSPLVLAFLLLLRKTR